jgi:glycyl-tRNA synthetase
MFKISMDEMTAYCKEYGFIFQGSEIYGGLANTWDYGPLGTRLKNRIKDAWRYWFIQCRENSYEIDSGIFMNPNVWKASGHTDHFSDSLLDCRACKTRHRADALIAGFDGSINADAMTRDEMLLFIRQNEIPCPACGKHDFTNIRDFNLMFSTSRGVTKDSACTLYLRPETAQGEYINYLNVGRSMRVKPPFGIGQIGKAFRNEITPGNFTFRTIEFEQMEYQFFCKPGGENEHYRYFKDSGMRFFEYLGINKEHLRFHDHNKLAHYAKAACDIEYLFPFGWGEINGTHNRSDYDLKMHQQHSGTNMSCFDEEKNEKYIPCIIESTYGLDRIVLAVMFDALRYEDEETGDKQTRLVLHIKPGLAPFSAAVLPLIKKRHSDKAREIYRSLMKCFPVSYDDSGSIGRRYRRCDAAGTPIAVTVDDQTLEKGAVTIRDRDTMRQEVVATDELISRIAKILDD